MHSAPLYMHIIVFICCMVSVFFSLYTATSLWKPKLPRFFSCFIGAFLLGANAWGASLIDNKIIVYLLFLAIDLIFLKLVTHITWTEAFLGCINSVFHYICLEGITVGVFALVSRKNLYQIITVPSSSLIVVGITMILLMLCMGVYHTEKVVTRIRALISSETEMTNVILMHAALFLFMLFFSYNYYYNLDLIWFSFSQLLLSLLMLILYHLILNYGSRISYLINNELHQDLVNNQLKSQLAQYESYTESFVQVDRFKTRFREVSLTLRHLIYEKKYEKAETILENDFPQMLELLPSKKEYSNSLTVNAFMLEWARRCQHEHIQLDGLLYVPENLLSHEERILYLLTEIRDIYMYLAGPVSKATITLMAKHARNRFIINISGPFKGIIEEKDEYPYFITANGVEVKSCYHRLVTQVDGMNGTLFWSVETRPQTFTLTVSFHSR